MEYLSHIYSFKMYNIWIKLWIIFLKINYIVQSRIIIAFIHAIRHYNSTHIINLLPKNSHHSSLYNIHTYWAILNTSPRNTGPIIINYDKIYSSFFWSVELFLEIAKWIMCVLSELRPTRDFLHAGYHCREVLDRKFRYL